MDPRLVQRVREGRELPQLLVGCLIIVAIGTAAYGATIGMWRGPWQGVFASLKLVGLFAGLLVLTTLTNAVMGGLLRARLSLAQVASCCALGLAVTAAILGALAPVSWFVVRQAPAPDATQMDVAVRLLSGHVVVLAIAGALGVRQVFGLLRQLVQDPAVARRVLWMWLAVEGLVGAELSWVLRPFLGKPNLEITFLRADAFDRSFFDEVASMATLLMGPPGVWIVVGLVLGGIGALLISLSGSVGARYRAGTDGLTLQYEGSDQEFVVPWSQIRAVSRWGSELRLERLDPDTLQPDVVRLPLTSVDAARAAYETIEWTRRQPTTGFRSPALT